MDKVVIDILEKIEEKGFCAYVVGGYARDLLLGIHSFDVDICTNALPQDIKEIFEINEDDTYGGLHFNRGLFNIDITTFRKEIRYVKRKPIETQFVNSIEEDIKRRDFTINAIYMDKNGKVIDLLNGREDLEKKTIHLIGKEEKLVEDPLRMLRAIRFATTLDFNIESDLFAKIAQNKDLIITLSGMRLKEELEKIFASKNFAKGLFLFEKLGIKSLLGLEYKDVIYTQNILGMWSQIKCVNIPFTKEEKSNIIKITEIVNKGTIDELTLYRYGIENASIAGEILQINSDSIKKMNESLPIKKREDIKISNTDIISITNINPSIVWQRLEEDIIFGKVKNDNDLLKKYLKYFKESD